MAWMSFRTNQITAWIKPLIVAKLVNPLPAYPTVKSMINPSKHDTCIHMNDTMQS